MEAGSGLPGWACTLTPTQPTPTSATTAAQHKGLVPALERGRIASLKFFCQRRVVYSIKRIGKNAPCVLSDNHIQYATYRGLATFWLCFFSLIGYNYASISPATETQSDLSEKNE